MTAMVKGSVFICLGMALLLFIVLHLHLLHQNYLPFVCGAMNLTIPGLLTLQMLYTKFGSDRLRSSWEEDVNGRRTTTDANQ